GNDADNLQPAVASGSSTRIRRLVFLCMSPHFVADGIADWAILPRHVLIHYREHPTAHIFGMILDAALCERNTQQREIFWADEVYPHFWFFRCVAVHDFDPLT